MYIRRLALGLVLLAAFLPSVSAQDGKQPNVVIVITDDQGYGDTGFSGNPIIKTPNIDKLLSLIHI